MPVITRTFTMPRVAERQRSFSATGPVLVLVLAAALAVPLMVLSVVDVANARPLWDNLHWSITAVAAAIATAWSVRGSTGRVRAVRTAAAVAFATWCCANLTWAWLNATGQATIPSIADVFVFATVGPGLVLLALTVRGRMTLAEEIAVFIDSALGFLLIVEILLLLHGGVAAALPTASGFVAIGYPTAFIGLSASGLVAFLAARYAVSASGPLALAGGTVMVGCAYLGWIAPTVNGTEAGSLPSILFTAGTVVAAFGAATWNDARNDDPRFIRVATFVSRIIGPTVAGVLFIVLLIPVEEPVEGAVRVIVFAGGGLFVTRQALLLRERTKTLATVTSLTEENGRLVGELRAELQRRAVDERRMIAASRAAAVGDLAAGVAHEVNNPLTGVLGFAELLIAEMDPDDPRRPDLETIRGEALRARAIVRALRDFASPRPPTLAPTDLSELVGQTVNLVRYSIERRGATIREDLPTLEPILIDSQAVQQAVLNILTNARQAIGVDGHLDVAVAVDGTGRLITITDDGVGMDAATARLAFEPFFSTREDGSESEPGAGLGLSVSNGLIASHGGTISIRSRPGLGTTVEIRLPGGRPDVIAERGRGKVA